MTSVLEARKTLTHAEIREMTGWTRALRLMEEIRRQGHAQARGRGRGAHWEWVSDS